MRKLADDLERDPMDVKDAEWAEKVDMPLPSFRRRLFLGRRAKDKMVSVEPAPCGFYR